MIHTVKFETLSDACQFAEFVETELESFVGITTQVEDDCKFYYVMYEKEEE